MKKPNLRNTVLKLALVASVMTIYGTGYCWMRAKGRIYLIEEGSSRGTHLRLEVKDSDEFRGRMWDFSIPDHELRKLAETERANKRNLRILFSPLMFLEALVREPFA